VLDAGHFFRFNRCLERFQSIADFLNLVGD
jgi:hypothetical protein